MNLAFSYWALGNLLLLRGPLLQAATVSISSNETCRQCRVVLSRLITLQDTTAQFLLDPDPDQALARDSQGRFYVVSPRARDHIVAFDPQGYAIGQIGRAGGGPGEYRYIQHLAIGPGDSLHVWDRASRRITVLGPAPRSETGRTYGFPNRIEGGGFLILPSGEVVANADVSDSAHFGRALHRYTALGVHVASWGVDDEVVKRSDLQARVRFIARGQEGIWALRANAYHLQLWDLGGRPRRELRRVDARFPAYTQNSITPDQPPKPIYLGVQERQDGTLAVLILVPDSKWREGLRFDRGPHGTTFTWLDRSKVFDTLIEILDPTRGRLLVSHRMDEVYTQFVGEDLLAQLADEATGVSAISIWRMKLEVDPRRRG